MFKKNTPETVDSQAKSFDPEKDLMEIPDEKYYKDLRTHKDNIDELSPHQLRQQPGSPIEQATLSPERKDDKQLPVQHNTDTTIPQQDTDDFMDILFSNERDDHSANLFQGESTGDNIRPNIEQHAHLSVLADMKVNYEPGALDRSEQQVLPPASESPVQQAPPPAAEGGVQQAPPPAAEGGIQQALPPTVEGAVQQAPPPAAEGGVQQALPPTAEGGVQQAVPPTSEGGVQLSPRPAAEGGVQQAPHPAAEGGVQIAPPLAAEGGVQQAPPLAVEGGVQQAPPPAAPPGIIQGRILWNDFNVFMINGVPHVFLSDIGPILQKKKTVPALRQRCIEMHLRIKHCSESLWYFYSEYPDMVSEEDAKVLIESYYTAETMKKWKRDFASTM